MGRLAPWGSFEGGRSAGQDGSIVIGHTFVFDAKPVQGGFRHTANKFYSLCHHDVGRSVILLHLTDTDAYGGLASHFRELHRLIMNEIVQWLVTPIPLGIYLNAEPARQLPPRYLTLQDWHTLITSENMAPHTRLDDTSSRHTRHIGHVGYRGAIASCLGAGQRESASTARLDIGPRVEAFKAKLVARESASGSTGIAEQVVGHLATAAARRAAAWTAVGQAGRGVTGIAFKEATAAFKGAGFGAANGCGIIGILACGRLGSDICRGQGSDDGAQIDAW